MSDTEEVFFWEHPAAQAKLRALHSLVHTDTAPESETVSANLTIKKLDQSLVSTSKSTWIADELYSRRLRTRDWKKKFDRLDGTGVGDHRA